MKKESPSVLSSALGRSDPRLEPASVSKTPKPNRAWRFAYIAISIAYLVFVAHQPVAIFAVSPHDDGLFWKQAASMLSGDWLGPYSQMTMPKGVGFPVLLAVGAILSIPVHVVAAIVLIGCLAILMSTLRLLEIPEAALFGIFIATLAQSSLIMERPLRENLYASLTLVLISIAMTIFTKETGKKVIQQVFLIGIVSGVFLVTREESIWVVPGLSLVVLGSWILAKRPKLNSRPLLRTTSFAVLGLLVAPLTVGVLNFSYYGTFKTQDFTNGNFPRALEALQSVTEEPTKRWVPVTLENREAIYEASSSFNELRSYFEGPGMGWTEHGCKVLKDLCGEYAAGWFMWALRDAVASVGYYSSPEEADAFFGRLSMEVESACSLGTLECKGGGFWLVPELTEEATGELFPTVVQGFRVLTLEGNQPEALGRSVGDPSSIYIIRSILGSPQAAPLPIEDSGLVRGWHLGPEGSRGSFGVKCRADSAQPTVTWMPSPDLVLAFGDQKNDQSRFQFSYPGDGNCQIILGKPGLSKSLFLKEVVAGTKAESGDFQIHIDYIRQSQVEEPFRFALALKNGLSLINSITNPIFLWGGFAALVLAMISTLIRESRDLGLSLIIAGLYGLVFSRVALLALVSVTSFPTLNVDRYALPAFALISLAGALSFVALIREIRYWASRGLSRASTKIGADS